MQYSNPKSSPFDKHRDTGILGGGFGATVKDFDGATMPVGQIPVYYASMADARIAAKICFTDTNAKCTEVFGVVRSMQLDGCSFRN